MSAREQGGSQEGSAGKAGVEKQAASLAELVLP